MNEQDRTPFSIVVVDGETAAHGGISWGELDACGSVTVYPRCSQEELLPRIKQAHAVITNKVEITREPLCALSHLKYIGVTATGYNIIDVEAARERGIAVTNVPAYSTDSVAQHVFALLLSFCSPVARYASLTRDGSWSRSTQFCLLDAPLSELRGKTIGIVGYGSIGRQVAAIASAFGMQVLATGRPGRNQPDMVSLEELLKRSDIVTLHCPLTEESRGLVNHRFLRQMKDTSVLINTSRGGLIVESDLYQALDQDVIAYAALDVLEQEPPLSDNPLLSHPKVTITPHVAWATHEARARLVSETAANLSAFLAGERRNRVD